METETNLITLTPSEFLERWKLLNLYEPMPADAEIEYATGLDLDRLLMMQAEAWYVRQFSESPREILPVSEIASILTPERLPDGAARVRLPERTIAVVSVEMEGWHRPALIVDDDDSPIARSQSNPFSRGGIHRPVAVVHKDASLTLFTPPMDKLSILSLKAILRPEKGVYLFTPELLSTLPSPTS